MLSAVVDLAASVQYVKGVGPQRAEALAGLGVRTAEDLLFHVPMRYEDRRQFTHIADLRAGTKTVVAGVIEVAGLRRARRMAVFELRLADESGRLKAVWFNQPYLREVMARGRRVVLYGSVERDRHGGGRLMMASPEYELIEEDDAAVHMGRIVPIYEKLGPLTGKGLRRVILPLAAGLAEGPDPLSAPVRERLRLLPRHLALRRLHDPGGDADLGDLNAARSPAHRSLILEELFLFQLGLALRRQQRRADRQGIAFRVTDAAREAVKRILPFPLTAAQKRVLREIADDMQDARPMNRLLQGDVGAGKTVVALLAMVIAVENGYQAALMAPTEVLAEQHALTLGRLLARCRYTVALVSAGTRAQRAEARDRLRAGHVDIAVGTHALIQEQVGFRRLGLAVVDEQHRFGVLQREDLLRKGYQADLLVMTATPIPRTLALTAYGDLDVSLLDERPPGRTPVRKEVRAAAARRAVQDLVRREVAAGHQAYVVYPLVEESEKLEDVAAARQMAERWQEALPGVRVALLHGRMKSGEKEAVMASFAAGEAQVLVATTVIEVGVDVPNATLMVIENAERFGLASLHQLRGRVGRGRASSSCVLVTHGRLSEEARARLEVMVRTDDGFVIAEEDLRLRGPGDFFGTRQWGLPAFRVADLMRDRELLETARAEAFRFLEEAGPAEAQRLLASGAWARRFALSAIG
jgi:ATP-dependent DNA helicase RecG